jgi:phosphoribosylformylglycinamidine cyclo-ligase
LIRKVLEHSGQDPSAALGDTTVGEALLAPTRIYVKTLLPLLAQHDIDGLAHITGGGISENIIRVVPPGLGIEVDLSSWQWPEVFRWLQTHGGIDEQEMLRTFNCGIGMVLLVQEGTADVITQQLAETGETVYRLGRVVEQGQAEQRVNFLRS